VDALFALIQVNLWPEKTHINEAVVINPMFEFFAAP